MKVLLLGSTGLLGQAMAAEIVSRGFIMRDAARSGASLALDVGDAASLARTLADEAPDLVVNCAAIVDVARCEEDPGKAYRINARPLAFLADWSQRSGNSLIHVSTDHYYVEGEGHPHAEDEPVTFVNEYARSKFAGEALALTAPMALVLRTSIVGVRGWEKLSFAEWAIKVVLDGEPVQLFSDSYTSSIDVGTFAKAALDLAGAGASGLLNLAAGEVYTKGAFVREMARQLGRDLPAARVASIKALRPPRAASLGLDVREARHRLGYDLPGLEAVVASVLEQYRERHSE